MMESHGKHPPSDAAPVADEVELLRRAVTEPNEDMPLVVEDCGCRWLGLWVLPCYEHIQLFASHPEDAPRRIPLETVLKQDKVIEIDEDGKVHLPEDAPGGPLRYASTLDRLKGEGK